MSENTMIPGGERVVQGEASRAPTGGAEQSVDTRFVGDVLLTFGAQSVKPKARMNGGAWMKECEGPGWSLYLHPQTQGWKGFPLSRISVVQWEFWLLGELFPAPTAAIDLAGLLSGTTKASEGLNALNGHFLLFAHDLRSNEWHVSTDRFGTLHAYYGSDGTRSAIGTFFPAVAGSASSRKLDWDGLYSFFSVSFFPDDRTYFDDVRILHPSSNYIFDGQGKLKRKSRYWNWHHSPARRRTYEQTIHEFSDVFAEVMRDQMQSGRIAMPISGGLDSRSTIAALRKDGDKGTDEGRIWSYSYGYTDESAETRIAHRIAHTRQLPFRAFTIPPYLFGKLSLVIDSVEGYQDLTQSRQAAVVDEISQHADFVIAAHWGDVWMDDMGYTDNVGGGSDNEVADLALAKFSKNGGEWFRREFFSHGEQKGKGEEILKDFVRSEFRRLEKIEDRDFRMKAFKTNSWSFRWTLASLRMFQGAAFTRLPFYDSRLCDFFCTVPTEYVKARRLQVDYIKRCAPDLARIAWQPYDANLYWYKRFHSLLLPRRAVKRLWRMAVGTRTIQRNWEVQFLGAAGRANIVNWLLRPGLHVHEYVSPASVEALVNDFYASPTAALGYSVSMLLTFSVWLECHA